MFFLVIFLETMERLLYSLKPACLSFNINVLDKGNFAWLIVKIAPNFKFGTPIYEIFGNNCRIEVSVVSC